MFSSSFSLNICRPRGAYAHPCATTQDQRSIQRINLADFWTFGIDDVDVIKKPSAQQIEQARKDNKPTKKRKDYII